MAGMCCRVSRRGCFVTTCGISVSWRAYHEATKHTAERLRRSRHTLDWENMPDPYRRYEGAPVCELPVDPLSKLFHYSAAISAVKRAPSGTKYALRVNPSSGNLHPTEFHFAVRGVDGMMDGLYHYRPDLHRAERRGTGDFGFPTSLTVVLSTNAWREAWKYRERAYRYCLLDAGHAWGAVELAARELGLACVAEGEFDDTELSARLGLPEDEWPMLVLHLGAVTPRGAAPVLDGGRPNALSAAPYVPETIRTVHAETARRGAAWIRSGGSQRLPAGAGARIRGRRSALDFHGDRSMSMTQLEALLAVMDRPVYVYVHAVEGLAPGVYRQDGGLQLRRAGGQRVAAAGLSLGQDLAGNACVAFSLVANIDALEREFGPRAYRYAHFEAGAMGQRLYIAAECCGLRATGIGAFYDDRVREYLGLTDEDVLYHFAVGHAVRDERLEG